MAVYTVEVEESRPSIGNTPSAGPVYRSIYAKDGLMELPQGIQSPWEFFSRSVERNPKNPMLGRREIIDGKVGPYVWQTYQEVYDKAIQIGSAIRGRGINSGGRCGIYGSNCPEWIITVEACNSHGIYYVPLYDTLGANAVEFIINHAEVSIAFIQENKIEAMITCLPRCAAKLKTIVSFGKISSAQKKEAELAGVSCFSWDEFSLLGSETCKLPPKEKSDICTIMYTSGTTGDPKGVLLTNGAIMAEVMTIDHLLVETDKAVTEEDTYFSFLPLAHVFDQIIETYCIYKGASIGFWRGDVRYLVEDIQELKPTIFCGVPRVYDRIYTGINDKISSGGAFKRSLFQCAYNCKLKSLNKGLKQDKAAPFCDRIVFNKIKQGLGGRVRIMLSGAAPLSRHIEEFLRVTSGSIKLRFPLSYRITTAKNGFVEDFFQVSGGKVVWNVNCRRSLHDWDWEISDFTGLLECLYHSAPISSEDELYWKIEKSSCFLVRSLYDQLHKQESLSQINHSFIWKYEAPPKILAFGCLAGKKKILTIDNLKKKGMVIRNICLCCMQSEETVDHLLLHC